jgi:hypothetical protein
MGDLAMSKSYLAFCWALALLLVVLDVFLLVTVFL